MKTYEVTKPSGVIYLADGRRWRPGERFSENQLPPNMVRALVKEGAVKEIDPRAKPPLAHDLMRVEGVTEKLAYALQQIGVDTPEKLSHALPSALSGLRGVSQKKASELIEAAKRTMGVVNE